MSLEKKNKDLLSGSLWRNILMFTLPIALSGMLQLVFNAADLIVVGKFDRVSGSLAQAAIGSTGSMINLIIGVFLGVSIGVNVVIARLIGAKQYDHLKTAVQTAMVLGFIAGAVIAVLGFIFTKPLLRLIDTDTNVMPFAVDYLRIYFIGAPFSMIYNFGSAVMRAWGDTKRPTVYLTIGGIANVIMNLFTVIVLGMGVRGVAIATTTSNLIACVLILIMLVKTDEPIKLHIKGMRINPHWTMQVLALGLPAGVQGALFSLSNVIIQSAINSFSDPHITAGNGNAGNIEGFVYIAMNSFCQSSVTFTGQSVGAKNYKLVKKALYTTLMLVSIVGITLGAAVCLLREPLMGLYSSNAEDIAAGMNRLIVICSSYFLCGLMEVTTGAIRGMGNSTVPMIITLIGACGMRIAWIYTVFRSWHTAFILYISYPISWTITFAALLMFAIHYRKRLERQDSERQKSALAKESSEVLKNNA